nr:MAG TPA: tail completion protein [Caudoviricetes sp.]
MLSRVVSAISNTLEKTFPEVEIYVNKIKQGFEEPCFFIQLLNPNEKQVLGNRYKQKIDLDIQYFPKNEDDNWELMEMAQKLNNILEVIKTEEGDLLRGLDRNSQFIDGKLHYFITFKPFVRKVGEEEPFMEELKTDVKPDRRD